MRRGAPYGVFAKEKDIFQRWKGISRTASCSCFNDIFANILVLSRGHFWAKLKNYGCWHSSVLFKHKTGKILRYYSMHISGQFLHFGFKHQWFLIVIKSKSFNQLELSSSAPKYLLYSQFHSLIEDFSPAKLQFLTWPYFTSLCPETEMVTTEHGLASMTL